MKSVYADEKGKGKEDVRLDRPEEFAECARKCIVQLRETMDGNEVRALVSNKIASPCLQVTIEDFKAAAHKFATMNPDLTKWTFGQ